MQGKGPMRNSKKEQEWRERVQRWQQSGESVRAFCRREGLHESAFFAWRRELTRRGQERQAVRTERKQVKPSTSAKPIRFFPVQVALENRTGDPGGVEILLDAGRAIRVRPGFDRRTLAEVLAILEASPC